MCSAKEKGPIRVKWRRPCSGMPAATYVIIGHSERRKYFHETDETVNREGQEGAVCRSEAHRVRGGDGGGPGEGGYGIRGRPSGRKGLFRCGGASTGVTIAYEPVWAIGTGKNATPDQAAGGACFHQESSQGRRAAHLRPPTTHEFCTGEASRRTISAN